MAGLDDNNEDIKYWSHEKKRGFRNVMKFGPSREDARRNKHWMEIADREALERFGEMTPNRNTLNDHIAPIIADKITPNANKNTTNVDRKKSLISLLKKTKNQEEIDAVVAANVASSSDGVLGKFAGISDRSLNVGAHYSGSGSKILAGGSSIIENMHMFALNRDEFLSSEFKTRNAAARTLNYMNPFNASVRSDMMNGMGLLTKAQKIESSINKSNAMELFTKGYVGFIGYEAIKEGNDPILSTINSAASLSIIGGATTIGRGIGGTIGTAISRLPAYKNMVIGKGSTPYKIGTLGKAARIGGVTLGEIGGLAAGIVLTSTDLVSQGLVTMGKSDGYFNQKGSDLFKYAQYASKFQSQESMTMRQKALSRMSKSGINDRSMALGNESLILRGLL
jgi:hypothetical protein